VTILVLSRPNAIYYVKPGKTASPVNVRTTVSIRPMLNHDIRRRWRCRRPEVHLVSYRTLETPDKDAVANPAPYVDADLNPFTFPKPGKLRARELRPLVHVEDPPFR
jgi:hypothetical protein